MSYCDIDRQASHENVRKMQQRKETHKKHNEKRKMIQVSLYQIDRQKMVKKYGHILTATEAKEILLEGKITVIVKQDNADLNAIKVQLKKVGNNINQIAHYTNQTKHLVIDLALRQELKNIDRLLILIHEVLCGSK